MKIEKKHIIQMLFGTLGGTGAFLIMYAIKTRQLLPLAAGFFMFVIPQLLAVTGYIPCEYIFDEEYCNGDVDIDVVDQTF